MNIQPTSAPPGGPAPGGLVSGMQQQHGDSSAKLDKLQQAQNTLDKTRKVLDGLMKLGDTVSAEDVIEGAGRLVAAGLAPSAMAQLLADMPEGGQALAAWVQQHDADVTQREQQLDQVHGQMKHEAAVNALRVLAAHHIAGQAPAVGGSAPAGGPPASLPPSMSPGA